LGVVNIAGTATAGTLTAGDTLRMRFNVGTGDFNIVNNTGSTTAAGTATGTATFTNSTNNIALTGIGSIVLEIGDVVQVTGTASNNKLFTVEVITDSGNVIVNQAHAGGTTRKSLVNETVSATVTLLAKWYNAPIGLGRGWVKLSGSRSVGTTYTNNTGRGFQINVDVRSSNTHDFGFSVNGDLFAESSANGTSMSFTLNPVINSNDAYAVAIFTGKIQLEFWENR